MQLDWNVLSNIASPIIALGVGVWINRKFEDRARLIAFYGHIAAFKLRDESHTSDVFTHSVVIRNTGRRAANNVLVSHRVLPVNFTVFPPAEHRVVQHPDGGADLVFPILVPNEQIIISYLYFPPIIYNQVTAEVRSNEGFAKILNVLPTVPPAPWFRYARTAFASAGVIAVVYLSYVVYLAIT